ncbi:MAG: trypsin-like peptidase domain-containing protein [Acidobacteria bacterium]|nr:trypsin-like peptidase domain-containing protein [Acidobacteriota bacterium]
MFAKRKKSVPRKILSSLTAFVFAGSLLVSGVAAQTNVDALRNAAITPEKLSASFAEVARAVEPAVVNIDTKSKVPDVSVKGDAGNGNTADDLLDLLRRQRRPQYAVGSGFIVDKAGYIMTNFHVVEDSSRITVQLQSGEEFTARIVGVDEETDLAVLKIDAGRELPFVRLGDSEKAQVGDWVLAIGSPFGLAQTVTAGIVSQLKRETPYTFSYPKKFIQTDAAINRGNSGGPLVNMNAEVIGVNSQIATATGDSNGIGFALPINDAAAVYRQIVENGKVRRGYLGVGLDSVKAEFAKVYGLPEAKGAIVLEVRDRKSAAALAGLQAGDIILEFNGQKVESAGDLIGKVSAAPPDQNANVVFMREVGAKLERRTTVIKLAERPSNNKVYDGDTRRPLPVEGGAEPVKPFGLTLSELTPALVQTYKLENNKGLLVKEINPASYIADVKASNGDDALVAGDLIQRINRTEVTDLKTFGELAGKLRTGDAVVLQVLSNNRSGRGLQMKIVQFTVQ